MNWLLLISSHQNDKDQDDDDDVNGFNYGIFFVDQSPCDGGRVKKVGHLSAGVSPVVKRDLKGQPRERESQRDVL